MAAKATRQPRTQVLSTKGETTDVFIDTSGFFALLSTVDPAHTQAREQMARLAHARQKALTTDHVLDETFTLLKVRGLAHRCPVFQQMINTSRSLRVSWTEPAMFIAATELFLARLDQGFSLTDCVSFTTMERAGLQEALTTDHHFQIAGFVPLLLQRKT